MNKITIDEQKAIASWTSPLKEYRHIKSVLKNIYSGSLKDTFEKRANILLEMFNKYNDNTNSQILYRGDVLESQDKYSELLNKKIDDTLVLEDCILSFTFLKDVAIKSYIDSDKMLKDDTPSVLIIIVNRKSTFLDISKYSCFPDEQEVICNKNLKFIIKNIEKKENNHLIFIVDEV